MRKKLLIIAGGTGGHIFPGLTVADFLKERNWNVVWMGNPDGMEAKLVPDHGYKMALVRFSAVRGKGLERKLKLPFALLSSCWQAAKEIRRIQPDVVLGMGGYVSFPGGLAAALLGYPLVIHEQNSIPGLANRALSWVAKRRVCGFPNALSRSKWLGNPVRKEIVALPPPAERLASRLHDEDEPLRLLVLGGSLGASVLNEMVPKGIRLIGKDRRPLIVHQSGEEHLKELKKNYAAAGVSANCVAFIDNIADAYAWADLVLCRAGALSIAELAACGIASILVPYPSAVDDHQTSNAKFLASTGAAILLPQDEMSPESISLIQNYTRGQLYQMAERARAMAMPKATENLAQICEGLVKK